MILFCSWRARKREEKRRSSRSISLLNGKILWKDTNRHVWCTRACKLEREKCKRQAQQKREREREGEPFSSLFSASGVHTHTYSRSFHLLFTTVKKKGRARDTYTPFPLPNSRARRLSVLPRVNCCSSWILHRAGTVHAIGRRVSPYGRYIHVALMSSVIPRHNSCTLTRTRNSTPRAQQTYEQLMFA